MEPLHRRASNRLAIREDVHVHASAVSAVGILVRPELLTRQLPSPSGARRVGPPEMSRVARPVFLAELAPDPFDELLQSGLVANGQADAVEVARHGRT